MKEVKLQHAAKLMFQSDFKADLTSSKSEVDFNLSIGTYAFGSIKVRTGAKNELKQFVLQISCEKQCSLCEKIILLPNASVSMPLDKTPDTKELLGSGQAELFHVYPDKLLPTYKTHLFDKHFAANPAQSEAINTKNKDQERLSQKLVKLRIKQVEPATNMILDVIVHVQLKRLERTYQFDVANDLKEEMMIRLMSGVYSFSLNKNLNEKLVMDVLVRLYQSYSRICKHDAGMIEQTHYEKYIYVPLPPTTEDGVPIAMEQPQFSISKDKSSALPTSMDLKVIFEMEKYDMALNLLCDKYKEHKWMPIEMQKHFNENTVTFDMHDRAVHCIKPVFFKRIERAYIDIAQTILIMLHLESVDAVVSHIENVIKTYSFENEFFSNAMNCLRQLKDDVALVDKSGSNNITFLSEDICSLFTESITHALDLLVLFKDANKYYLALCTLIYETKVKNVQNWNSDEDSHLVQEVEKECKNLQTRFERILKTEAMEYFAQKKMVLAAANQNSTWKMNEKMHFNNRCKQAIADAEALVAASIKIQSLPANKLINERDYAALVKIEEEMTHSISEQAMKSDEQDKILFMVKIFKVMRRFSDQYAQQVKELQDYIAYLQTEANLSEDVNSIEFQLQFYMNNKYIADMLSEQDKKYVYTTLNKLHAMQAQKRGKSLNAPPTMMPTEGTETSLPKISISSDHHVKQVFEHVDAYELSLSDAFKMKTSEYSAPQVVLSLLRSCKILIAYIHHNDQLFREFKNIAIDFVQPCDPFIVSRTVLRDVACYFCCEDGMPSFAEFVHKQLLSLLEQLFYLGFQSSYSVAHPWDLVVYLSLQKPLFSTLLTNVEIYSLVQCILQHTQTQNKAILFRSLLCLTLNNKMLTCLFETLRGNSYCASFYSSGSVIKSNKQDLERILESLSYLRPVLFQLQIDPTQSKVNWF